MRIRQAIKKLKLFSSITVGLILFGCSENFSDDDFLLPPPEQYDALIETGWAHFQSGMFLEAIDAFIGASHTRELRPSSSL